jgi:hypothetical protein
LFPFSTMPSSTSLSSSSPTSIISPDQLEDVAYSPVLLPNHGAGTGRGARLELLHASESPASAPVDCNVDRCMPHAVGTRPEDSSSASPGPVGLSPAWSADHGASSPSASPVRSPPLASPARSSPPTSPERSPPPRRPRCPHMDRLCLGRSLALLRHRLPRRYQGARPCTITCLSRRGT